MTRPLQDRPRQAHSGAPRRRPRRSAAVLLRRRVVAVCAAAGLLLVVVVLVAGGGGKSTTRATTRPARAPAHRTPPRTGDGSTPLDTAVFAPGACEAFAPTTGDRHATVFLDAGHGGIDPGAVGATTTGTPVAEAVETLPIELDAMAELRRAGYRVVVSRTSPTTVVRLVAGYEAAGALTVTGSHADVAARDVCANMAGAAALVGIYLDAGAPSNAGCVTAYDTARPFAAANERFAGLVQSDVLAGMNAQGWAIPDEGAIPDSSLGSSVSEAGSSIAGAAHSYDHLLLLGPAQAGYFDTPSTMPGALIEPLFVTDPFEAALAAGAQGQHVIASGVAQAVETFLAPPAPPVTAPAATTTG